MSSELTIFENPEFGSIRTVEIDSTPYFVGKDVAEVLGYAKARNALAAHVDDEDKKDAPRQATMMWCLTVRTLYQSLRLQRTTASRADG